MSMFYELMMRKKEQIMYATIKGTLTENDGVFSGFSASNYLVLQDDITEIPTDFEIQTRISIPATNSGFAIHFLSYSGNSSGIRVFSSGKLNFYSKNNDNNAVEIIGTTVLSLDTFYFIKIKKVGNTITLYSSTDKTTWTTEGTTTTTSTIPLTSKIGFGHCGNANNNNYIFNGSIDLPNSYIKLGSTKYNLQAVVGYTVVGSPAITDGVVSGFSSANYLSLPITKNIDITEICMKINIPSSALGLNKYSSCLTGAIQITVYSSTTKFTYANVNINGIGDIYFNVPGNISPDTDYWLKYVNKGAKCQTYWSTDGVNFTLGATKDNTITLETNYLNIGGSGSRFFEGIIDLNETYIKVNNKLWFNGQQA